MMKARVEKSGEVFLGDKLIGTVDKNFYGWIARDPSGQRLYQHRPTISGTREFGHFETRREAIKALIRATGE